MAKHDETKPHADDHSPGTGHHDMHEDDSTVQEEHAHTEHANDGHETEGHGGGHGHHGHGGHKDMVEDFKKRFFISLILTLPILAISPMIQHFLGVDWRFGNDMYVLFALSTIVFFYGGWPFLVGGIAELKDKAPGMMTLIALAITIAYSY
ncbi:MAG: heavy metal translocating P-type ATPase, partial [Planococcus citreus]